MVSVKDGRLILGKPELVLVRLQSTFAQVPREVILVDELIAERAAQYGLTPEEYRRRNLLSAEITSRLVARSTVALCTDDFAATTGAQVPVDGGSERVI